MVFHNDAEDGQELIKHNLCITGSDGKDGQRTRGEHDLLLTALAQTGHHNVQYCRKPEGVKQRCTQRKMKCII